MPPTCGASARGSSPACVYEQLPPEQLRAKFEELRAHFRSAVHEGFRTDDCHNNAWCERMLATLFLEGNEAQTEQILSGLSPEFFLQVEWLPGGRFEGGEFLFDSIFEEAANHPEDAELQRLCDPRAKGIIFNFIREYGDLEYVNVGCVPESLSLDRPAKAGPAGRLSDGVPFAQRARPHQALHSPPEMGRLGAPGRRQGPAAVHQGKRGLHRLLAGPAAGLPPVGHEHDPPGGHAAPERDL